MQNAKCNSAKCKIWFWVGVRHILREAWLFALAYYPAHLLATVVFVMSALLCELSNEKISIFVQRGRRISTFDLINSTRSPKCCHFMVRNVGKYGTFPGDTCVLIMNLFWFADILSGNGAFLTIILRGRDGYQMIDYQLGA